MESAGHFLFELFKIGILSAAYSFILFQFYKRIWKKNYKQLLLILGFKRLWLRFGIAVYTLLLVYMFTYWGDHGLGDSARIPLGHGAAMSNINWTPYATLDNANFSNGDPIQTTSFFVHDNIVAGNCDSDFYSPQYYYFIYDLDSRNLSEIPKQRSVR